MKEKAKKPFRQKLLNQYRLVVLNESTYEERLSYKLSKLNIFLFLSLIATLIIISTISLIAFTSIKEYIPGYDSTALRTSAVKNIEVLDSLTLVIEKNQDYLNSIGAVLLGEKSKEAVQREGKISRLELSNIEFFTDDLVKLIRNM